MKKYYVLFLLVLINGLTYAHSTNADSLISVLETTSNQKQRFDLLEKLYLINRYDSTGHSWLRKIKEEARAIKDRNKEDWAYRTLALYYYNYGPLDSVIYYAAQSDSLATITGTYSDYYYDAQTFLSQYLLWEGDTEKATNTAIQLYNLAKEHNNKNGIICSSETLGLVNQQIERDSIAVNFLTEALHLLKTEPGEQRYIVQILYSLIESEIKLSRTEEASDHISLLEDYLKKIKSGYYGPDPAFQYERGICLIKGFQINLCIQKNNLKEAEQYIHVPLSHLEKHCEPFTQVYYLFSVARYYKHKKEYSNALTFINQVLQKDTNNMEALELKANLLYDTGNIAEAAQQYKNILQLHKEKNTAAFVRQMSQLYTLHDMNQLELQVKDLRVKELELNAKKHQITCFFILLSILGVSLIICTRGYMHTIKLKNELQNDKQALLESENELRIARDQAEESDRLKSIFLSNMSHEIRTPLNAIVGFAQILELEMDATGDCKEYTQIIINNSALLLNLVNDILDISRLESERYRFSFAEENLTECCHNALASIKHRVKEGVELRFVPEEENFYFLTDKLRLQQVLINLLSNAAKFTERGSIELAFQINKASNLLRFTITDTGSGIPKEKQDAIFERFEKLNECIQGTGLGLSICRIIAGRFNGSVVLDKEYTGGARFIFTHSLNI